MFFLCVVYSAATINPEPLDFLESKPSHLEVLEAKRLKSLNQYEIQR
jgi:hypothetical protein